MPPAPQKMGPIAATAMSVTIVVGAGLLTLPGLSFAEAGRLGHLPWLLMALIMLPLLGIFAWFARRHPSAGGVVAYVRISLGERMAAVGEAIILGTFSLGMPAIALIGATYLQQSLPGLSVPLVAMLMVTLGLVSGLFGVKISGGIQTAIAVTIVLGLLVLATGYWFSADLHPADAATQRIASGLQEQPPGTASAATATTTVTQAATIPAASTKATSGAADSAGWIGVFTALPLILFAYTGWELTSFLAEDMQEPARNLPRTIWASFAIVTLLYVYLAWTVAQAASPGNAWKLAPVAQLAHSWLGATGLRLTGLIATLLIMANVTGAFLSCSRAVYAAGREGLLPRGLGTTGRGSLPVPAMLATWALFMGVIGLTAVSGAGVELLLQLAGQNFFVLYLLATLGFIRLQTRPGPRLLGIVATLTVVAMLPLFSLPGLIYCSLLGLAGWWRHRRMPQCV